MEAALRVLLPRMVGDAVSIQIYVHQCKDDLLARLPERLRGYKAWLPPTWKILVLVDRDDDRCETLKEKIEQIAMEAGIPSRSRPKKGTYAIVNRIVIEELEAWYFGDWEAVRKAYPRVEAGVPAQAKYRVPDAIKGGTWEALERVLKDAGYFKTGLRKIELARAIAAHMDPSRNRSRSFQALLSAVNELTSR